MARQAGDGPEAFELSTRCFASLSSGSSGSSGDSVATACGGIFIEETLGVCEKEGDAPDS